MFDEDALKDRPSSDLFQLCSAFFSQKIFVIGDGLSDSIQCWLGLAIGCEGLIAS